MRSLSERGTSQLMGYRLSSGMKSCCFNNCALSVVFGEFLSVRVKGYALKCILDKGDNDSGCIIEKVYYNLLGET